MQLFFGNFDFPGFKCGCGMRGLVCFTLWKALGILGLAPLGGGMNAPAGFGAASKVATASSLGLHRIWDCI